LAGLRARHGVYAVLGNHDYWCGDPEAVTDSLKRAGVQVLVNRSARLSTRGVEWSLAGVDDVWGGKPDLDKALQDLPPNSFHLLLCHAPDFADKAAERGVPLQLSGHSHGGQVRVPGVGALVLPKYGRRYASGLQRLAAGTTQVYTNVGLGVIFPPLRVNCPPEITLLTLTRA
jgi:predicted MPP superfamily phosphohydrolase